MGWGNNCQNKISSLTNKNSIKEDHINFNLLQGGQMNFIYALLGVAVLFSTTVYSSEYNLNLIKKEIDYYG
jgi:hypothetical protein